MTHADSPADRRMETRAVEMTTPDGVLRGKIAIKAAPIPLAGLVPAAYELTNALVRYACDREEHAGLTISCRAGCGACCRQMVPLSPPEAFYLMDVIESLEPQRRSEVAERFNRIVAVLEERGMIEQLLDPQITDEPVLPIARQYFALHVACPFLVDESCSIHTHRPVACRDFNVTSPAARCANPRLDRRT